MYIGALIDKYRSLSGFQRNWSTDQYSLDRCHEVCRGEVYRDEHSCNPSELYLTTGLRLILTPLSSTSMPHSFFMSPQLVDPCKPLRISTARYITSVSLLMLLEVGAEGGVPLEDN